MSDCNPLLIEVKGELSNKQSLVREELEGLDEGEQRLRVRCCPVDFTEAVYATHLVETVARGLSELLDGKLVVCCVLGNQPHPLGVVQ